MIDDDRDDDHQFSSIDFPVERVSMRSRLGTHPIVLVIKSFAKPLAIPKHIMHPAISAAARIITKQHCHYLLDGARWRQEIF